MPQLDQFRGCLVGQCLGDALGFPVEGSPPEICAPYIEELRAGHCEPWPAVRGNYAFGQYTDDSQLARELMLSYAEMGRFDPADYAARIRLGLALGRVYCTFTRTAGEGIPFATTCRSLVPRSWSAGTSKCADTKPGFATAILLGSCVRL